LDNVANERQERIVLITALASVAVSSALQGLRAKYRRYVAVRMADYVLFVREHHATPTGLYLTDPFATTLRLAAMMAQFISWKTHPYLSPEAIEWKHRVDLAVVLAHTNGAPHIDSGALRCFTLCLTGNTCVYRQVDQESTCRFLQTWFVGREARIMIINRSALVSD
jgi:hypothetical protein